VANLKERWHDLPEQARYIIVGGSGVAIGWLMYNIIYILNPAESYRATSSWLTSYLFAVVLQHSLHYRLTFKNSTTPYLRSLTGAFTAYSGGLVVTTILNAGLTEGLQFHHQFAWLISVGSSVVLNYILLKRFAFIDSEVDGIEGSEMSSDSTSGD